MGIAFQRRPVGAAGGKGGATYLPAVMPAGMGAAGTLASGGRPVDMRTHTNLSISTVTGTNRRFSPACMLWLHCVHMSRLLLVEFLLGFKLNWLLLSCCRYEYI